MQPMPEPGTDLVRSVRVKFNLQGGSLHAWCQQHDVDYGYAYRVLAGDQNSPAAKTLRARIIAAAERQSK